jgi:hypothetical protein
MAARDGEIAPVRAAVVTSELPGQSEPVSWCGRLGAGAGPPQKNGHGLTGSVTGAPWSAPSLLTFL